MNPALIGVDKDGKPYTVRYNQINAMLLNEFLKEHQTVQQLKGEVSTFLDTVVTNSRRAEPRGGCFVL